MTNNNENNENNEPLNITPLQHLSKEMVKKMIEDNMIKEDKPIPEITNLESCEDIGVFSVAGNFIHSVDYMDDPLFLEASSATLECAIEDIVACGRLDSEYADEDAYNVVDKKPATLTGYLLYNSKHEIIGFSCFSSQVVFEGEENE